VETAQPSLGVGRDAEGALDLLILALDELLEDVSTLLALKIVESHGPASFNAGIITTEDAMATYRLKEIWYDLTPLV
jgi:hypothetical protein